MKNLLIFISFCLIACSKQEESMTPIIFTGSNTNYTNFVQTDSFQVWTSEKTKLSLYNFQNNSLTTFNLNDTEVEKIRKGGSDTLLVQSKDNIFVYKISGGSLSPLDTLKNINFCDPFNIESSLIAVGKGNINCLEKGQQAYLKFFEYQNGLLNELDSVQIDNPIDIKINNQTVYLVDNQSIKIYQKTDSLFTLTSTYPSLDPKKIEVYPSRRILLIQGQNLVDQVDISDLKNPTSLGKIEL